MNGRKKLGIFLYNRLFDPLIQSNFWLYISHYLEKDNDSIERFYLVTYEDSRFPLTEEQTKKVREWEKAGLVWTQLKWSPGIGVIPKAKDIIQGFFSILKIRFFGCKHFVSLASVAGTYLYLYNVLIRFKFFLYQFEPHSEYAIDNDMWSENSFQYRVSHFLERKASANATVIASGTRFMQERLKNEWKVKARFFKIPTVANDRKFLFSEINRERVRRELGFNGYDVLLYPGKFGDLYYREETAFMFKWLKEEIPNLHFLIVTPHQDEEVIQMFDKAKVDPQDYTIQHSGYENIHQYYAAADFAVIAVPPGPSKKFISNIKVGEYLTAGLPFLITRGISEDYIYAEQKQVGVVVDDFKEDFVRSAAPEIVDYLKKDKDELRQHCRQVGLEYRGFEKLNQVFRKAVSTLIMC